MKYFAWRILNYILLLILVSVWLAYNFLSKQWFLFFVSFLLLMYASVNLYHFLLKTNRKLKQFFESVKYNDFSLRYTKDSKLGKSFSELNQQLNDILDAFHQARAEKEASLHYLNNIVQHIKVGILSFDDDGKITLINQNTYQLLNVHALKNIAELQKTHPILYQKLKNHKNNEIYEISTEKQILMRCSTINLRGKNVNLVSLQNIGGELKEKELEAWQNLTKILRHEIMNSVTPLLSLIGTMKEIINEDIKEESNAVEDLRQALQTIENRGKGVMNFVSAYREFTTIPTPIFTKINIKILIENIKKLFLPQIQAENISLVTDIKSNFSIAVDENLFTQVLINLLKNAFEAVEKNTIKEIKITTYIVDNQKFIEIKDSGIGIEKEALEKIFIPFYSTKPKGSGVGLSLSMQILYKHNATLKVNSEIGKGSSFLIGFER